jgi:circadian clock protein KaiC
MTETFPAARRTITKKTGIAGLDEILNGGLHADRIYLVEGNPGTGKTTLALKFLLEGAALGETGLYITLSETADELRDTIASHGWSLHPHLRIVELIQADALLDPDQQQSLLYSSDLELGETTRQIMRAVEELKPRRMVIDSLAEIRRLAQGSLRFRRQVLALKHYFMRHHATVLLLDDLTAEESDRAVHSIVSGVLRL